MRTYTVIFAEDVPHYATVEIRAGSDADAIEAAKAYDRDGLFLEPSGRLSCAGASSRISATIPAQESPATSRSMKGQPP